jgi:glycine hydroxymethyltransferase
MINNMPYLKKADPKISALLQKEQQRQQNTLMMIPSENYASQAVLEAIGSEFQNKYCEGYPGKRYYQGQMYFDQLEKLCQQRVKKLFGVSHSNVQALSGAPANSAVYHALLKVGDPIMGLALDQGGHLSHGLKINFSGKYFDSHFYYVDKNGRIDYERLEKEAKKIKPKLIIAGITSYPLRLDFSRFAKIADSIGAYLLADVAHVAGLIIAGAYPDPAPEAHIITTTTHKTLRGARGALIMVTKKGLKKDPDLSDKIDRAVFPGLQGGPHMNNMAGIAVALKEAQKPSFKQYGRQVVRNACELSRALQQHNIKLCSGGTDTHLMVVDLTGFGISGKTVAEGLEEAGIVINYNSIPYDPNPPFYPSGLRLGTPAITSRGMKEGEMRLIAEWIAEIILDLSKIKKAMKFTIKDERKKPTRQAIINKSEVTTSIRKKVKKLCFHFPIPSKY